MMYTPHILQKRIASASSRDEYGRIIPVTDERWETVCACRCDDNATQNLTTDNGEVFRPDYHVVCPGKADVKAGDYIRVMDGGEVRGWRMSAGKEKQSLRPPVELSKFLLR